MKKIEDIYKIKCNEPSDINEHLPTLLEYGKKCEHITEMGVRWVCSTWPFLLANPKKLISYDIKQLEEIDEVKNLAHEYNINYYFIENDVLKIEIEETDLLFIDTLHTYNQLISELELHSDNVKKYIILHDTESFGIKDEVIYDHASEIIKNKQTNKSGLINAIEDFLMSKNGTKWMKHGHFTNNNGLTILQRK